MNDLEELRIRAEERRKLYSVGKPEEIYEFEADLDRAIAIAEELDSIITERTLEFMDGEAMKLLEASEKKNAQLESYCSYVKDIEAQRDKAIAAAKRLQARNEHVEKQYKGMYDWRDRSLKADIERDKAIAAGKALREGCQRALGLTPAPSGRPQYTMRQLLADTAWLEDK